jgi:hypothetical protein
VFFGEPLLPAIDRLPFSVAVSEEGGQVLLGSVGAVTVLVVAQTGGEEIVC